MTRGLVPIYTIYIIYINPKTMKKPKGKMTALEFLDEILGWAKRNQHSVIPVDVLLPIRDVLEKVGSIRISPTIEPETNANKKGK